MMVERFGPRLHAIATRLCGNRADAEDAVQETFLAAFRGWHGFKGRSDPGTWLYTIAVRRCRAKLRARHRREQRLVEASRLLPWGERVVTAIGAAPNDPGARHLRQEAVSLVQSEISRLPEHLRLPLVLKEVIGLSVSDVAAILDLAPNTVKTRVHRGRLALRRAMMSETRTQPAPTPIYEKQMCIDLLKAKMAALDRGAPLAAGRLPSAELCARCRAVFRELDLVQEACAGLAEPSMPATLRRSIMEAIRRHERPAAAASQASWTAPRTGRPPVARSRHRTR